ncbi:phage portal protein [Komagataeibacter nataicola]|uniref:Phage portal protein n=1 Tax=Komagataeibacter nataicola TaxID=265960 RepID=A0ABX5P7L8_9PROT|nr:phage portal protein [Komagataeibacter nataicola]PYD65236.1 phage portal protein [Komagataeibacter nataicola]WNM07311.1 phage portal protein [Komagataeibacter nataicola]
MGFFNKREIIKKEPTIDTKSAAITEPSISLSFFPGFGGTTASGVSVTNQTVLQLSAAYACINFISTDIGKIPLHLQVEDNGGWKINKKHPLTRVLKKPNKRNTLVTLLQQVVFSFLISGNGYIVIIRAPDGTPIKLIPVDDWACNVQELMNGDRIYTVTSKMLMDEKTSFSNEDGITRTIREEDIIHIQNNSLYCNYIGLSPIQMASEVFGLGLAAQESAARAFQNGSFFQGYLKVSGTANKNKTAEIAENWNRVSQSVTNSGKTPVVPADVEYVNTGASPSDLQLLESREQITKEIARMYKVPGHKLGFNESDKAANMEQQERAYIGDALETITRQFEEQLDTKMLFDDELGKLRFKFDFSKMIQADQLQRYQSYAIGITNGFLNQDEARELEGRAPLPDGEGQVFHTPTYTAQQDGTGSHNITDSGEKDGD